MTISPIRRAVKNHRLLHSRLKRRLVFYPIIALVMFGVVIYDAVRSDISPIWILLGMLLGVCVGWLVGQIFKIYWRDDLKRVVMGIDRLSVLLIIVYVLFRIYSDRLLGQFLHGQELTITTYSLLAGILLGRLVAVLYRAGKIFESRSL